MENGPQIRTIGNASERQKEQSKNILKERLFSHFDSLLQRDRDELQRFEYPKSETVVALIDFANKETSRLMEEINIEPYDVPVENYHIVLEEFYKRVVGNNSNAIAHTSEQGMLFNGRKFEGNHVHFGAVAIHETLHLKAHLSLEVSETNGTVSTSNYRRGVKVGSLQEHSDVGMYHEHFKGLDEAIVATQEKKSLERLLEVPQLTKEKEWMLSDSAKQLKKELSAQKGVSEGDIIWVDEKNYEIVSYPKQRETLQFICSEIQIQFPEQYKNSDDVFNEFLKSHFTGKLLPIARLVERTFGEGSFRLLGNMDTDKSSGVLHLESFKKARMRQLRSKE